MIWTQFLILCQYSKIKSQDKQSPCVLNVLLCWGKIQKTCESVSGSVISDFLHPMDCSLPGSSVHEFLQARILEWIVISSSRQSSWPRDETQVFCIVSRFFTIWTTREAETSLLAKVYIIKAMAFLVVMYGYESWTMKRRSTKEFMLSIFNAE